jgi:hypothetical protein
MPEKNCITQLCHASLPNYPQKLRSNHIKYQKNRAFTLTSRVTHLCLRRSNQTFWIFDLFSPAPFYEVTDKLEHSKIETNFGANEKYTGTFYGPLMGKICQKCQKHLKDLIIQHFFSFLPFSPSSQIVDKLLVTNLLHCHSCDNYIPTIKFQNLDHKT